jgi:hypothetical protein
VGDALLESGLAGAVLPAVDTELGLRGVVRGPAAVVRQAPPAGIDLIELHTGADYLPAVQAMLESRERRRAR